MIFTPSSEWPALTLPVQTFDREFQKRWKTTGSLIWFYCQETFHPPSLKLTDQSFWFPLKRNLFKETPGNYWFYLQKSSSTWAPDTCLIMHFALFVELLNSDLIFISFFHFIFQFKQVWTENKVFIQVSFHLLHCEMNTVISFVLNFYCYKFTSAHDYSKQQFL